MNLTSWIPLAAFCLGVAACGTPAPKVALVLVTPLKTWLDAQLTGRPTGW